MKNEQKRRLILVVDDEDSVSELIAEILQEHYDVLVAYNGREAFKLIREHLPSLVLSDVMMPEMSGHELVAAVRANPQTRHIPIILLSAAFNNAATKSDADAFIRKPFDIDELEQMVARFMLPNQMMLPDPRFGAEGIYSNDSEKSA